MSIYAAVAGAISVGVGLVLTGTSGTIIIAKSNQSNDKGEKAALRAAATLLGISLLFAILTLISAFVLANTKSCSKKSRIFFIIFFVMFLACYITALTIIKIYANKRSKAGDTAGARDLNSSFYLPLVAIAFYMIGFIILYIVVGKRLKGVSKYCR